MKENELSNDFHLQDGVRKENYTTHEKAQSKHPKIGYVVFATGLSDK